jgi:hypothetical protein
MPIEGELSRMTASEVHFVMRMRKFICLCHKRIFFFFIEILGNPELY